MGVLIKDMDMPKRCIECPLCWHIKLEDSPLMVYACSKGMRPMYSHETAEGVDEFCKRPKPDWCPLVEVPTPHGRLVEFIDVIARVNEDDGTEEVCVGDVFKAYYEMKNAPTVIEAEE